MVSSLAVHVLIQVILLGQVTCLPCSFSLSVMWKAVSTIPSRVTARMEKSEFMQIKHHSV